MNLKLKLKLKCYDKFFKISRQRIEGSKRVKLEGTEMRANSATRLSSGRLLLVLSAISFIGANATHDLQEPNDQQTIQLYDHHSPEFNQNQNQNLNVNPNANQVEALPLPQSLNQQTNGDLRGKKTLYACEEKQLQIECQTGEFIHLVRANYGRFSIQICNEHAQLDWKVNCMSSSSYDIISKSCQAKQSCQLLASSSIFGDFCPGTQKYLEVHYICVTNAIANSSSYTPTNRIGTQQKPATEAGEKQQVNVIQPQAHQDHEVGGLNSEMTNVNSLRNPLAANSMPMGIPQRPQLPTWMMDVPLQPMAPFGLSSTPAAPVTPPEVANATGEPPRDLCPEMVLRQVRWPSSESGLLVRMSCPAHTLPSQPMESNPMALMCLPGGRWARRLQSAKCQSIWLRNLSHWLEAGDSPLSTLTELVRRTRLQPVARGQQNQATQVSQWQVPAALFGDDITQIGRMLRRLVEEMAEFMNRITDDKQRLAFAREFVQSLVELTSNLAQEQQSDAWMDLAQMVGERQRLASQLVQSLESAAVLLASASQQSKGSSPQVEASPDQPESGSYLRVTENVYISIKSLQIASGANHNQTIEVSFPSRSSLVGTRWFDWQQKFTLHLQVAGQQSQVPADYDFQSAQALKVVFVMIRGLGSQMEPKASIYSSLSSNSKMSVNSNLVSLAIVAENNKLKVDLAAPVELLFRHLQPEKSQSPIRPQLDPWTGGQRELNGVPSKCVYWDANISDWLGDGCKLIETNATHSVCACNHLTSFALLSDLDESRVQLANNQWQPQLDSSVTLNPLVAHENQNFLYPENPQTKVQLDNVENELILSSKLLYLAKMLDGHLFGQSSAQSSPQAQQFGQVQQQLVDTRATFNLRLFIYISCLVSGAFLAIHLAAVAYNKSHARRLLSSIPAHPPAPQLVTSNATVARLATRSNQANPVAAYSPTEYPMPGELVKVAPDEGRDQSGAYSQFSGTNVISNQISAPVALIVQLLALQIVVVFLVESQNYYYYSQRSQLHRLRFSQYYSSQQEPQIIEQMEASNRIPAIGAATWTLVLVLIYLISCVTCWLAAQLVSLNLKLLRECRDDRCKRSQRISNSSSSPLTSTGCSSAGSDKIYVGQLNSLTISNTNSNASTRTGAVGGMQMNANRQQVQANLYGCHAGQQMHTNSSPGSSFASSTLHDQDNQLESQNQHLNRVDAESNRRFYCPTGDFGTNKMRHLNEKRKVSMLDKLLWCSGQPKAESSPKLTWIMANLLPIVMTLLAGYLSFWSSNQINSVAFTSSTSGQLAVWPLLMDCSLAALSLQLYYAPALCFLLVALALFMVRRSNSEAARKQWTGASQQEPHILRAKGSDQVAGTLANPYGGSRLVCTLSADLSNSQMLGKQSYEFAGHPVNPKAQVGACSWQMRDTKRAKFVCTYLLAILALHSICWISFFAHIHQTLNSRQSNYQLMYAFAASNLALVLVLLWSQRHQLRRAAQLAGLQRLCCQLAACSGCTDGATSSPLTASPVYPADRQLPFLGHNQHKHQHQRSTSSGKLTGAVKVSPSSQSLFLVSQPSQQQQMQTQYETNYHYGPIYAANQQQHLYQQLAGPQHLYDSTSGLNIEPQRLNQQPAFTLDRSAHWHSQQQQVNRQPQAMTLRPNMTSMDSGNQLLLLDSKQQTSGEADGPLVAFSSSINTSAAKTTQATFGPPATQAASQSLAHQTHQRTELRPFNQQQMMMTMMMAPDGREFLGPEAHQCQAQQPVNKCTTRVPANYADALKAAMIQQQQQQQQQLAPAASQNQRRPNHRTAKQPIDREHETRSSAMNIYDVANYMG